MLHHHEGQVAATQQSNAHRDQWVLTSMQGPAPRMGPALKGVPSLLGQELKDGVKP